MRRYLRTPASGGNDMLGCLRAATSSGWWQPARPGRAAVRGSLAVPPISAGGDLDDIHPMRRGGVKSFVDDLGSGRVVVISRAATSLRSVETQPLTRRLCSLQTDNIADSWSLASLCTVTYVGERILQVRLLPPAIITLTVQAFLWQWVNLAR
ncbi:CAunnamed protein product [Biomphalaria glabrata]|nr:CAunnamed protein product [Biomphalaria glabrata]